MSVSTTFHPAAQTRGLSPDVTFLTQDNVYFYVHSSILLAGSTNHFGGLIPIDSSEKSTVKIPEIAPVLNIILHAMYNMSCTAYSPTFRVVQWAIELFPTYGLEVKTYIAPQTPLFVHLTSFAPLYPIDVYALAAHHDLEDLATVASTNLLSYQLSDMDDALVDYIGPLYLRRLFFLHLGRTEAFKRILFPIPPPHPATAECDFEQQKSVSRAWQLAATSLAWTARPDMSPSSVESTLASLTEHIECGECRQALKDRVKDVVVQWAFVKTTI
ncbi:hypothetical protein CYLTODRAFT_435196 [Cylindrobasidium torrendii FP15055 ss-10]|uniref:BTB domain-containing protein n=1 Tax=Cylindrobasidium torrendii FP15055 ss-10 TaxID=1314674 RepID=A0A0D7BPN4_9AGAR|nr:hypothetical protein CYLTODRAFT_435196 [Cylindrobasidium torrendii FP15055 ss-10]